MFVECSADVHVASKLAAAASKFTLGRLVRIIFSTQNSHTLKSGHIYVALVRLNEEGREATFPPSLAPSDIAVVFAVLRRSGNC